MQKMQIPVGVPDIDENEVQEVVRVVRAGWIARGKELEEFEQQLAQYLNVEHVVTVNSGTAAIEVALRTLDIEGKEVITTTTSCAPTANAIIHSGNIPVMVDISPEDFNINPDLIEKNITARTGALLPVHIYGRPVQMDKIMALAEKHHLPVIEDCAQSLGASWKGKKTGSFGEVGCFSLNINKIITTGEGGFIATNDAKIAETAKIIRNYGREISRSDYCYTHFGYNFKLTNLQAAIGLAQLQKINHLIEQRRKNAEYLTHLLQGIPELQLPIEKEHEFGVYFSYPLILKLLGKRDQLKEFLEQRGIEVRTLFRPMCAQPYYQNINFKNNSPEKNLTEKYNKEKYPHAEFVGENGLYVGCYPRLTKEQLEYMASAIREGIQQLKEEQKR